MVIAVCRHSIKEIQPVRLQTSSGNHVSNLKVLSNDRILICNSVHCQINEPCSDLGLSYRDKMILIAMLVSVSLAWLLAGRK